MALDPRPEPSPGNLREAPATSLLYLLFASTGAAIVIPGTLLSSLLLRWSLNDAQAGLLFFCFFVGSSAGALLSRGRLAWSIVRGTVLTAAGIALLSAASRLGAFAAMLLFGVGLGIAMTSISLFQSRRRPNIRVAEMTRLNLIWAVGAVSGPAMLLHGVARWNLNAVLWAAAAEFLLCGVIATIVLPSSEPQRPDATLPMEQMSIRDAPWKLLAMVPLATGLEAGIGAWLAAYSRREGMLLAATISTVTCFWLGLLLSRLVQSIPGFAAKFQRHTLRLSPILMIAGTALLLAFAHIQLAVAAGALLAGLGVGPLYPLILGLVLDRGEARNLVFLAGGIGSSTLPLLTGIVSDRTGSLTIGLTIPLVASIAMALLAIDATRVRLSEASPKR
ncbi:fucose permease [Granulicella aggregans]|uniref:Fucose permease n=1 Tax=Granulicella aggregans TaxID=474949 RepID=A0A7W8E2W1_9BACT|nr:MFS transporter [Granulicella aggregans]MBB5057333.1 fucose permease [Granulicella aggregans]